MTRHEGRPEFGVARFQGGRGERKKNSQGIAPLRVEKKKRRACVATLSLSLMAQVECWPPMDGLGFLAV